MEIGAIKRARLCDRLAGVLGQPDQLGDDGRRVDAERVEDEGGVVGAGLEPSRPILLG